MRNPIRGYAATLLAVWVLLCIGAWYYSQLHDIPSRVVYAVLPAFLVESAFYLAAGTPAVRAVLERSKRTGLLAGALIVSALIPYLLYALGTGSFRLFPFLSLLGLSAVVSLWYVFAKPVPLADVCLLILMAAVYVAKLFNWIYPEPAERVTTAFLGVLMWIRLGILSILCIRKMGGIGFGLSPSTKEWVAGFLHFLYFLPVGFLTAVALRFVRPEPVPLSWKLAAIAIATFLGTLWVLAAMEEFFFRGVLQQILTRKLHSTTLGIVAASLVFGAVHLKFRAFPNWKLAVLAAIAGLFYGRAYVKTGSVRAAMVTHALVVTTWRVFLY